MAASGTAEEDGVEAALQRTCELEGRLRQAIQNAHPLTTTLDWDFEAADREREALLAISEQLEYLEDKLREYRFQEGDEEDHKAVVLSQMDSVRRELVQVVELRGGHVMFGKEVVREVLAFAYVPEESGSEEEEEEEGWEGQRGQRRRVQVGEEAGHAAWEGEEGPSPQGSVLRSSYNRPPRPPSDGLRSAGKQQRTPSHSTRHASRSPRGPSGGSGAHSRAHRQQEQPYVGKGAGSPGVAAGNRDRLGSASPSAAATVVALSAVTAGASGSRRQIDLDLTLRQRYSASPTGRTEAQEPALQAVQERYATASRRQAEPEAPAPRGGGYLVGMQAAAAGSGRAVAGPQAAGELLGGRILSRMDRRPYSTRGSNTRGLRHEDIYGAVNGAGRPASITLTSPGQYGGMVRIQEMLARAEEGSQEPPPHTLQRPRIYGDGVPDDTSEWAGEDGTRGCGVLRATAVSASPARRGRAVIREEPIDDATLWKGPSRVNEAETSAGASYRSGDGSRRGPGLLGALGRLVLTGAAAAAVTLAARHAGPVVVEKGQHVVKHLHSAQQGLAAAARERREQERRAYRASHWQQEQQLSKQNQERTPAPAAARRDAEPQVADMPPWLLGPSAPGPGGRAHPSRLPPGAAAAAARKAADRPSSRQGPVQHVQVPPRSLAFPATPSPDLSVAMG